MQQGAEIYFNVARVGAESFFGGGAAEVACAQIAKELLAQAGDETLEPAADGGFVDAERSRDLEEGLAVKVVGDQKEAVFGVEILQGASDGLGKNGGFCGN